MTSRKLRVLLVPDSVYWVTGTIAKSIARANPWMDATILSASLVAEFYRGGADVATRFDLVHFICPYISRDWLPKLRDKLPVVTSHHHVTSWKLLEHNLQGDAIIAGSSEWVRDLAERGADMSRVFRVPYGVNVDMFTPATESQRRDSRTRLGLSAAGAVVGFFAKKGSNDDDRKGTDVFIEAVRLLEKRERDVGVLIVGPGWHEMVSRFRAEGVRCAWLPFVGTVEELPALYHALDFYWVTARVEGGPVPLLEAMSAAICCLTTGVGLALDVVKDGRNACLLPMNDPDSFARKTSELWMSKGVRDDIGREARQTMILSMRDTDVARMVWHPYARAREVFLARNPGAAVADIPPADLHSPPAQEVIPLAALNDTERKRARMLEALAWSENLVMYQHQRAAALRLIAAAWADNPGSLLPARVFLRRFLPDPVTKGVVRLMRMFHPRAA